MAAHGTQGAERGAKQGAKQQGAQQQGAQKEGFRVIVIGSPKVGKTSLIQRFLFNEFSYDVPHTAMEERKTVKVGGKEVRLVICDLQGQQKNKLIIN